MGKTRLVERFLALREAGGACVLRGRCYAQESVPHRAFDGLLDDLVNQLALAPASADSLHSALDAGALLRVFPALGRIPRLAAGAAAAPAQEEDPLTLRQRALEALQVLLGHVSCGAPLVLFVDDLQWADSDSAQLLRELLSSARPGLLFVGTARSEDQTSSAMFRVLRDGAAAMPLEFMKLGPLDDTATARLIQQLGDAAGRELPARDLARQAAGHPMLALELARFTLETDATTLRSATLDQALAARFQRLSAEARATLEVVALAGRRVPRGLVLALLPEIDLESLRELRLARATRETIADGAFHLETYHDKLREVVTRQVPEARRQVLYGRLADRALVAGAEQLELAITACLGAGRLAEAGALAERAALSSMQALAFNRAADLLELAIARPRDGAHEQRLRVLRAEACVRAGRALDAALEYERAARGTHGSDAFALRRHAMNQYFVSGHHARGQAILLALEAPLLPPRERDSAPAGPSVMAAPALVLRLLQVALASARLGAPDARTNNDERARARLELLWSAVPSLLHLDGSAATRYALTAVSLSAQQGAASIHAQALCTCAVVVPALLGRRTWISDVLVRRAQRLVARHGSEWDVAYVRAMRGAGSLFLLDFESVLDDCLETATRPDTPNASATAVQWLARSVVLPTLYWTGQLNEFSERVEEWGKVAHATGNRHAEVNIRVLGSHRYLRSDEPQHAHGELERARTIRLDYAHMVVTDPWWEVDILLYERKPHAALAACERMREGFFARSAALGPHRVHFWLTLGKCYAALAQVVEEPRPYVRKLQRCLREVQKLRCLNALPSAQHLTALLAALTHGVQRARQEQARAARLYASGGFALHAASFDLLGSDRGASRSSQARRVFEAQGVRAPERWANMVAPGSLV
jgi:hypothetical protein